MKDFFFCLRFISEAVKRINKQGGYLGSDDGDKNLMEIDFVEVDGQMIAIALKYPMEETEGLGTCIRVMADTFAVEK